MKGKYATQAKNRLANLDNELLQEAINERDTARAERDRIAQEMNELRRDFQAKAMAEGGRLAHDEVARLQAELAKIHRESASNSLKLFNKVMEIVDKYGLSTGVKHSNLVRELVILFRLDEDAKRQVFNSAGSSRRGLRNLAKSLALPEE